MGACSKTTEDSNNSLEPINVSVDFDGSYDHPNYTYDIKVKIIQVKKLREDGKYPLIYQNQHYISLPGEVTTL